MGVLDVPGLSVAGLRSNTAQRNAVAEAAGGYIRSANTGTLMRALAQGRRNLNVLIVGDSTGNAETEWVYLLFAQIAEDFPAYTFNYRLYNVSNVNYDAAVTLRTGTGPYTLTIWNASAPGQDTQFFIGSRRQSTVMAVGASPELIIVNHGHNEYALGANSIAQVAPIWRGRMLSLITMLRQYYPIAPICLMLQNPGVTYATDQTRRAEEYERVAALAGCGVIDTLTPALAIGNVSLTLPDGIHPNTDGSILQRDVAYRAFRASDYDIGRSLYSHIGSVAQQLMPNGNFASWDSANSKPTGFTLVNCTATQDTRSGYSDSVNGYGVRLQASSAAQSYMYQDIPLGRLGGSGYQSEAVTVAVLMRASDASSSSRARIAITDGVTAVPAAGTTPTNVLWWQILSGFVPSATAAYLRVTVYADAGSVGTADITVSGIHVCRGFLPHVCE